MLVMSHTLKKLAIYFKREELFKIFIVEYHQYSEKQFWRCRILKMGLLSLLEKERIVAIIRGIPNDRGKHIAN